MKLLLLFIASSLAYNCANNCIFNETIETCVTDGCNPGISPGCPLGCEFNDTLNVCVNVIDVDPTYTHLTPYSDDHCYDSNGLCPCKCQYNNPTNTCIPEPIGDFCNAVTTSACSSPCSWNSGSCNKQLYGYRCQQIYVKLCILNQFQYFLHRLL